MATTSLVGGNLLEGGGRKWKLEKRAEISQTWPDDDKACTGRLWLYGINSLRRVLWDRCTSFFVHWHRLVGLDQWPYRYGRHVSDPASTGPRSRQRVHLTSRVHMRKTRFRGAVIGFTRKNRFWAHFLKIDAKNLPTKIAMLTLKTCCESHGWPFSNLKTGICSREQA